MASLATTNITLPRSVADEIIKKARDTSVIQTLAPTTPQVFSDVSHILFSKEPEAEFVGEGAAHGAQTSQFSAVPGTIKKAHVTVRLNDEVKWADEDNQLQIIDAITEASASALGRALDYAVLHGLNPSTGQALGGVTGLVAGASSVESKSDPIVDLDALVAAVGDAYVINGLALSPAQARAMRSVRAKDSGLRIFPEIPLSLNAGVVDGIAAATSGTVNGRLAQTATKVLAIAGDFNLIKWGIVRDLGLEVITMGDPDGLGDLKKLGQVAFRTEIVYSWACIDPKGFAVLKSK